MKFKFSIFARLKSAWTYRSEPESMALMARVYWRTLLLVVFLAAVLSLLLGAEELSSVVQTIDAPASVSATNAPLLDRAQLQSTLDSFSARQSEYQTLSNAPTQSTADPSQ